VHDHPALHRAATQFERVVPVFVLDDALLFGRYRSDARTRFMLDCLRDVDASLRARGSGLTVRRGRPEQVLPELVGEHGAEAVLWTSDVAPYARARDRRVTQALRTAGAAPVPNTGTYAVDVSVPRPQVVFSRFFREWRELARRDVLPAPDRVPGNAPSTGVPDAADLGVGPGVPEPVRVAGETAARAALDVWIDEGVDHYAERQEGMARVGTSVLAPYLRWGCVSARECEARALERGTKGASSWRRQLGWRDFHAHTLLHHPGNVHHEQQERFAALRRDDDPNRLAAWAEGRTGFPLVDAGMRELRTTGFMHNRVRLVAGSLLTKELHLDHRPGARVRRAALCGAPPRTTGTGSGSPAPVPIPPRTSADVQPGPAPGALRSPRERTCAAGCPSSRASRRPPRRAWTMTGRAVRRRCVVGRDYPAPIVDRKAARAEAPSGTAASGEGRVGRAWAHRLVLATAHARPPGARRRRPRLRVETLGGLERLRTHRRRVHLVLVAMRAFAAELRERGIEVVHRTGQPSLGAGLEGFAPDELVAARPNNATALRFLERRGVRIVETTQFLTTPPQFAAWAAEQHGGRLVMEPFYRRQRERFDLLMREGGGPEGGRWNLDHLNRRPPTAETHAAPEPWRATEGPLDDEVRRDLDALGLDLWGEDAPRVWPATPDEARASLEHFCTTRLAQFGPWQDAMVDGHPTLFHSLLSAPMNLGFLSPLEVARRVEAEFRAGRVPLQSAEGFIRQVIGWREYMWGNYWLRRDEWPERNELDARMDLPAAFTGAPPARTGWRCLDSTVEKVWDDAYAHHIERLMVLGNILLIAGVEPWQGVRWFQSAFIDGAEWVMAPERRRHGAARARHGDAHEARTPAAGTTSTA
jgi:deoxyribodipyrimidine photolyase-like uncharacterized protein